MDGETPWALWTRTTDGETPSAQNKSARCGGLSECRLGSQQGEHVVGCALAFCAVRFLRSRRHRRTHGARLWLIWWGVVPLARQGASVAENVEESFVAPIPKFPSRPPNRFYFLFGKPIVTKKADLDNPELAARQYAELKAGVEGGISYLLEKRESD
eukprot:128559-Pyramimonas_sp.AAC.1